MLSITFQIITVPFLMCDAVPGCTNTHTHTQKPAAFARYQPAEEGKLKTMEITHWILETLFCS